jgi:3-oxoacyl-[acyl-carrier-protein] synthase II
MRAFIHSATLVSPQPTFTEGLPAAWQDHAEAMQLRCVEPAYREFLDPMASRRMSRIVKIAVCGAMQGLKKAGVAVPDGIISGTGLGCLEDTGKFLSSLYANEEKLLNPTPFIQSTHNTVAGAIALALKCHGYNATYSQRGFSFDSALSDALAQVAGQPGSRMLVCSFDEITETSFAITTRLGMWRNRTVNSLSLLRHPERGSLPGEGAAFFVISGTPADGAVALEGMASVFMPESSGVLQESLTELLDAAGMKISDIDLALLGRNGDVRSESWYDGLQQALPETLPLGGFKHLCGEYDTAGSFAVGIACEMIRAGCMPEGIMQWGTSPEKLRNILIYNHQNGVYHSFYLLRAC